MSDDLVRSAKKSLAELRETLKYTHDLKSRVQIEDLIVAYQAVLAKHGTTEDCPDYV